jgi:hypothetical protein
MNIEHRTLNVQHRTTPWRGQFKIRTDQTYLAGLATKAKSESTLRHLSASGGFDSAAFDKLHSA